MVERGREGARVREIGLYRINNVTALVSNPSHYLSVCEGACDYTGFLSREH
jgi:hypothetical protein